MQVDLDALRDRIRSAFVAATPLTEITGLRRPEFTDDDSYDLSRALVGKKWSELPADVLFYHRESLAALNAEAYRAYVAAYLLASIASQDPFDRHGPDLRHYLVRSLEPGPVATERVSRLSLAQHAVLSDVLRVLGTVWQMPEATVAAEAL